jgi:hypothetical protein
MNADRRPHSQTPPRHRLTATVVAVAVLCALLVSPAAAFSGGHPPRKVMPKAVLEGLDGLLGLVGQAPDEAFPEAQAATIIDFVENTPSDDVIFHAGSAFPAPSAYHRFDVQKDMDEFLNLSFGPGIPSYAFSPASVRFSKWVNLEGNSAPTIDVDAAVADLQTPKIFRGIEYMENTPDTFSGAYYDYHLYRTLILTRHQGRVVLFSLSKQTDVSNTGKKGVVLGTDDNWAYLYSGQNGLTVPGMGWVKSYMYDSFSVNVYIQSSEANAFVRCGVFKWVRAGWSSMNMVRPHHIYAGLNRYSDSLCAIIHHPRLPSHQEMLDVFGRIDRFRRDALKHTYQRYLDAIVDNFGGDDDFPHKWFADWFQSDDYLNDLTEDQMRAALVVEYVRQILGKPSCIDLTTCLIAQKDTPH